MTCARWVEIVGKREADKIAQVGQFSKVGAGRGNKGGISQASRDIGEIERAELLARWVEIVEARDLVAQVAPQNKPGRGQGARDFRPNLEQKSMHEAHLSQIGPNGKYNREADKPVQVGQVSKRGDTEARRTPDFWPRNGLKAILATSPPEKHLAAILGCSARWGEIVGKRDEVISVQVGQKLKSES